MRIIYLFICWFFCVFFCCKSKNNSQPKSLLENSSKNNIEFISQKKDSITRNNKSLIIKNIDSIVNTENQLETEYLTEMKFINSKYPFWGKRNDLTLLIKKTDSINKKGYECGNILEEDHEIWYYSNCEIEISNTEYVFRSVDFDITNFTVRYKDILFSKNYTLVDFKKNFPFSFKRNQRWDEKGILTISVPEHPLADSIYMFEFKDNKLVKLSYFFPC